MDGRLETLSYRSVLDLGDEDNGRKSLNRNGTALLRLNVYRIYTHQKVQDSIRSLSTGKRAFIACITDDIGYGCAIAKSLAVAGAEILIGTWVPEVDESMKKDFGTINILVHSLANGSKSVKPKVRVHGSYCLDLKP
ncbi:hypothetical protein LguiB_030387 [Lonicera macranthoides]